MEVGEAKAGAVDGGRDNTAPGTWDTDPLRCCRDASEWCEGFASATQTGVIAMVAATAAARGGLDEPRRTGTDNDVRDEGGGGVGAR